MADPCPRCRGTLVQLCLDCADPGMSCHDRHPLPGGRPCPSCLSMPATPELREVAREWLGHLPWRGQPRASGGDWGPWWRPGQPVVPAYLGAGRDLLSRALAGRVGLVCGATAPTWVAHGARQWELRVPPPRGMHAGSPDLDEYIRRFTVSLTDGEERMRLRRGMGALWVPAPTLATIPADAPPELRDWRALVVSYEEVARA